MKKYLTLVFIFTTSIVFGQPKMEFAKTTHDFGSVPEEGGNVSYSFEFTNTGNAPVILTNVTASCGCTTPEWSREPILPGKKGSITATFDPMRRPGINEKEITVNSNVGKASLKIRANVKPSEAGGEARKYRFSLGSLKMSHSVLNITSIVNTQTVIDSVGIFNSTQKPMTITFQKVPPHVKLRTVPATLSPNSGGYIVCTYDAVKKNDYGFVTDKVTLVINNKPEPTPLEIVANIGEDFSKLSQHDLDNSPQPQLDLATKDLGKIKKGSEHKIVYRLTNNGGRDMMIRKQNVSNPGMKVIACPSVIKPGETVNVEVLFKAPSQAGRKFEQLTLIINNPHRPILSLRLKAEIE